MVNLLDHAISVRALFTPETQDRIDRMLLLYAGDTEPVIQLTPEKEADLREADAEIARGELATDDEMQMIRAKYRLRRSTTRRAAHCETLHLEPVSAMLPG